MMPASAEQVFWERILFIVKGGICSSGMYDLKPVRLSERSSFIRFTR
jgi:hypothetical protein